jgi:hypothetical protein
VYSSKAKKSFLLIFMTVLLLFKLSPMVLRVHMRSSQSFLNTLHISKHFQIQNCSTNVISLYCIFMTAHLSSQLIVLNCSESKWQKSLVGTGHNNIKLFGLYKIKIEIKRQGTTIVDDSTLHAKSPSFLYSDRVCKLPTKLSATATACTRNCCWSDCCFNQRV